MSRTAPITVGIPTYQRGQRVLQVLERLRACDPAPAEILVFLDAGDAELEGRIRAAHPQVGVMSSSERVGPGGGRHRMLMAAGEPYFVTLDDDSWPVDADFFAVVRARFDSSPEVAVLAAVVHHQNEDAPARTDTTCVVADYTGCGHAMRVSAYRETAGYLDRPNAYGLEERDVALQLHCSGWRVQRCGDLRVYHDTALRHHRHADVVAATVENAALLAWLRYPALLWPYGLLQFANVIRFMIVSGRFSGLFSGVVGAPVQIWRHRRLRHPLSLKGVLSYLRLRHQHVC